MMTDQTNSTTETETGATDTSAETTSTEQTAATETTDTTSTDDGTVLGGAGETTEAEGSTDTETTEAATVPETYELTVPDGFESIDADVLAEATPILKELNLTNEQADKLTPIAAQLVKKTMDRAEAAITDRAIAQRKEWSEAFTADPEIGGANKDATVANAARAFDHYGLKKGEGLRLLLDESGLGNHPDLIRFVAKVGADLAEGTIDRGSIVTTPKTPEQALYGAEFQPKG